MTPSFHRVAESELDAAMKNGEAYATGLGAELLREVRRIVDLLCHTPLIGEPPDDQRRRCPLTRFPFGVIYRVKGDRLKILAIAHRRQEPGYWRNRVWQPTIRSTASGRL